MLKIKISKSEFDELPTVLQAEYKADTGVDSDSYLLETDSTTFRKIDQVSGKKVLIKRKIKSHCNKALLFVAVSFFSSSLYAADVPDLSSIFTAPIYKIAGIVTSLLISIVLIGVVIWGLFLVINLFMGNKTDKKNKQELEDQKLLDEGDIEKLILNRTEEMRAKHDGKIKSLETALTAANDDKAAMESRLSEILIDTSATNAVGALGNIRKGALPDVLSRARAKFKLVDGEPVAMNGKDIIYSAKNASEPMPITEWAESLAIEAPHLFEPSVGGGAKGSDVAPT